MGATLTLINHKQISYHQNKSAITFEKMDTSSSTTVINDCEEIKWTEVESALTDLCLKYMTIEDYIVVMNSKCDITIGGEPYLALQLWFNVKSGKIIYRIWDQTVSSGKVTSVSQFVEACNSHFKGRPCVGCPVTIDELSWQNYFISQTPIPRKISGTCKKILDPTTDKAAKSCSDCLKLSDSKNSTIAPNQDKNEENGLKGVANQAVYLQEIARKYPHILKAGKQFRIKIKTEDSKGCLREKVLLVDPTETLQQGSVVQTLSENDFSHAKRRNFGEHGKTKEGETNFPITEQEACSTEKLSEAAVQNSEDHEGERKEDKLKFTDEWGDDTNECGDFKTNSQQMAHYSTSVSVSDDTQTAEDTFQDMIDDKKHINLQDNNHITSTPHQDTKPNTIQDINKFKCNMCTSSLQSRSKLNKHIMTLHGKIRDLKCPTCNFTASTSKNLMVHVQRDHKNKCPKCDYAAVLKGTLLLHMKNDHGIDINKYINKYKNKCQKCDFVALLKSNLRLHMKTDHGTDIKEDIVPKSLTCLTCGEIYRSRVSLEKHQASDHGGPSFHKKCEVCNKQYACILFHRHMRNIHGIEGKFEMQCFWCKKAYSTVTYMNHAKKKHFYGKFFCEKCSFCGNIARDLVDHIKENHENIISVECPCCKKNHPVEHLEFEYKNCIKESYRQDTMCSSCGNRFMDRKQYNQHVKFHCAQQPTELHWCDKCGKKFKTDFYLRDHIKVVHENFVFQCEFCPKTFNSRVKRASHKLIAHSTDKKYQCKFCGLRVGFINQLKSHERTHQEPKFQCKFCEKKLTTEQGLECHERQHTGDRPFKCPLCDIGFPSRGGLAQHKRGVHKIEGPRGSRPGWDAYKKKSKSKSQLLPPK